MKIEKITEGYNFYQEGINYILELGDIKNGDKPQVTLQITELKNSKVFSIEKTCGCTPTDKTIVDNNTQLVTISYTQCNPTIKKTMNIVENKKIIGVIKIQGTCQ